MPFIIFLTRNLDFIFGEIYGQEKLHVVFKLQ